MKRPNKVKLVEVGPRDGLQNEKQTIPVDTRIEFINQLTAAGLPVIEVGSFVSPKWVPQMADTDKVFSGIKKVKGVTYPVLVPNEQGLDAAINAGVAEVSVFTAASETFSQKNTNCSIDESLARIKCVVNKALKAGLKVRAYVSCVIACPYEGNVIPGKVASLSRTLSEFGCYEISLGDTIGKGTPVHVENLIKAVATVVPTEKLAVHFHDTYGQALANIYAALQAGITVIDSAVSGLGGCPYAKGATGNVATEEVLYLLNGLGIETGVDLNKLINAGNYINQLLNRETQSKVAKAM